MRNLTTCGICGRTAELQPGTGWVHVTDQIGHQHAVSPDDGWVSGPDRGDREPCNACGHPDHDDTGECEEEVSTGLYGSDGVLVYTWCVCTGSVPGLSVPPVPAVSPDPWTDPDAAALASPPPF